jgi:hypothetical protein
MSVEYSKNESFEEKSDLYSYLQIQSRSPTIKVLAIYRMWVQDGKRRAGSVRIKNRTNGNYCPSINRKVRSRSRRYEILTAGIH